MKVTLDAKELWGAMTIAKAVTAKRVVPLVVQYVEMSTQSGKCHIRATNLDQMVTIELARVTSGNEPGDDGVVLLPPVEILRFLKGEKGDVTLEDKGGYIAVSVEDATVTLVKESGDMPVAETGDCDIEMGDEFIGGLKQVMTAVASEITRPVLNAVDIKSDGQGELALAAADGFRLVVRKLSAGVPECSIVVPEKAVSFIAQYMPRDVRMGYNKEKNRAWFRSGNILLTTQLVHGTFPMYQQLIPSSPPEWKFTVSGPMLEHRLTQYIQEKGISRLTPEDGVLNIQQGIPEDNTFKAKVVAKNEGMGKIAISQVYLSVAAHMFAEMTCEVTTPSSPMKIYGDVDGLTVVIMPMFVQW